MTINELEAQKAEIERQIAERKREQRASVIAQIKALMADNDLTPADLGKLAKPDMRKVVPIKYRHPSGQTWTGRGIKPKWLQAEIAQGKTPEQFLAA